jgi:hypothetical protein
VTAGAASVGGMAAEAGLPAEHGYAGMNSGHDRYWAECSCGWSSKRVLASEAAYAAWDEHARTSAGTSA